MSEHTPVPDPAPVPDMACTSEPVYVQESADVDESAVLGEGTKVWHLAQVRQDALVGRDCVLGRGSYLGPGVKVGDCCKIQNYALVYEPAELEDGVFIGPAAVLTNDQNPRAVTPDGRLKNEDDWTCVPVRVRRGAAVGARAVCVAPVTLGQWSLVAAGAVVTRDVPDFALVAGVPARQIGWVGHAGVRLHAAGPGRWKCPATGRQYVECGTGLREENSNATTRTEPADQLPSRANRAV